MKMGFKLGKKDKLWHYKFYYRDYTSKEHCKQIKGSSKNKLIRESHQIAEDAKREPSGSLKCKHEKSTFGDLFDFFKNHNPNYDYWLIANDVLKKELGHIPMSIFSEEFDKYIQLLKTMPSPRTGKLREPSTINSYIKYTKLVLNFACRKSYQKITGLTENPIADYETDFTKPRDRILSEDEVSRLFDAIKKTDSYLYYAVLFLLKCPVRRTDFLNLKKENYDSEKRLISFYPSKTEKRKPRLTYIPVRDKEIIEYFERLPEDCPYLFPKINKDGTWSKMPEPHKHWHYVLKVAGIKDFHWHDFKHCSITWMLNNGNFTDHDLRNLGIQYSEKLINNCYCHKDVKYVLDKIERDNNILQFPVLNQKYKGF